MFSLGKESQSKLIGVHSELIKIVNLAIGITYQDFSVVQGLRTLTDEQKAVATGHSQTMHSRHLTGHAVDLAPFVRGAISWDWNYIFPIALAIKHASIQLEIPMNWGGVWDKKISELSDDMMQENMDYVAREKAKGNLKPLLDGPHFQLTWEDYP